MTYSEERQAIYFAQARAHWKLATRILNETTQPTEFTGRTYEWTRDLAKREAECASEAFNLGLEQCVSDHQAQREAAVTKVRQAYAEAVDRHLRLRREYLDAKVAAEQDKVARFWGALSVQAR